MGHLLISCASCHDELRRAKFDEPLYDIRHHQAGPWLVSRAHWRSVRAGGLLACGFCV
jgi:hypothetical protein